MAKVTLIAKTNFLRNMDDELLADFAAGVCYNSPMKQTKERIKKCIEKGHESIIEHLSVTFLIEDISRACSHQIVRHRLASYSQESQRYVEMDDTNNFITPESMTHTWLDCSAKKEAASSFSAFVERAFSTYNYLRALGVPKQDARFVLPNATITRLVVTMNLCNWRHFIKVRADKAAQWEIQDVALDILSDLYELYPTIFGDLFKKFLGEVE